MIIRNHRYNIRCLYASPNYKGLLILPHAKEAYRATLAHIQVTSNHLFATMAAILTIIIIPGVYYNGSRMMSTLSHDLYMHARKFDKQ